MIAAQTHKALRVLLLIFAILLAVGGLLLIASSTLFTSVALGLLQCPPSFYPVALKFIGIVVLALSYLSYVASRDPVRYVAFIDTLAFLLIAASLLDLYASFVLHLGPLFTGWFVIVRFIIRFGIAIVLIALRPRQAS